MAGALGGEGDEDLGRADDLVTRGMVFADPRLVEAELVEPLDQLEIALEALGRVLLIRVERRQKDPVAEIGQRHEGPRSEWRVAGTRRIIRAAL
jgi:hypothetical protein